MRPRSLKRRLLIALTALVIGSRGHQPKNRPAQQPPGDFPRHAASMVSIGGGWAVQRVLFHGLHLVSAVLLGPVHGLVSQVDQILFADPLAVCGHAETYRDAGLLAIFLLILSAVRQAFSESASGSMMRNSSPPYLATMSVCLISREMRSETLRKSLSPST